MAELLVTLVMSDTMKESTVTMAQPGRTSSTCSCCPIQAASPDSCSYKALIRGTCNACAIQRSLIMNMYIIGDLTPVTGRVLAR